MRIEDGEKTAMAFFFFSSRRFLFLCFFRPLSCLPRKWAGGTLDHRMKVAELGFLQILPRRREILLPRRLEVQKTTSELSDSVRQGEKKETTSYAESPSFSAEKFPGGATVTLRHKLWGMLSVISTLPQNRR